MQFSGIGLFAALRWPCVCYYGAAAPPMDDAQKCCSYWSLCRAAEAARRRLEELSDCRTISGARCRKGDDRTAMAVRRSWARRSIKNRELAERIRADEPYIGAQSGVFKLPDGGAIASGSAGVLRRRSLYCLHGVRAFIAVSASARVL